MDKLAHFGDGDSVLGLKEVGGVDFLPLHVRGLGVGLWGEWGAVVGLIERIRNVELWMVGLVGLCGSEIISLASGLVLLLNFHHFLFHLLDLLFQLILFPNLPFYLFTILVFEHLLSSSQSLFL